MSFDAARPRVSEDPRIQHNQRPGNSADAGSVNPIPANPQPTPTVTPDYTSTLTTSISGAESGIDPAQLTFGQKLFKPMDDAFGPIMKDLAAIVKALDPEKPLSQLEQFGKKVSEIAGQIGEKMAQAAQAQPASLAEEAPQTSPEAEQAAAASAAQAAETAAAQAAMADDDSFEVMSFDDAPQVAQQAPTAVPQQAEQPRAAQQAQRAAQENQPAEAVQPGTEGSQPDETAPSRPVSETPIRNSIPEQADTQGIDLKAQFDKQWAEVLENRDARAIAQFLELQIQRLREKAQSLVAQQP